jgi:hypothetical protein
MPDLSIYDVSSQTITERDYTPDEKNQRKLDANAAAERVAEEAQRQQSLADAVAHAKTLGFTDDMIAVMYPGLAEK